MTAWDRALAAMEEAAPRAIAATRARFTIRPYDRARDLRELIGDRWRLMTDPEIVQALERAAGASAKAKAAGHWAYESSRHATILAALDAERERQNGKRICEGAPAPD